MDNGQQGVNYDSNFKLHFPEGTTHMTDFPEELLTVVNQHWADFDPQHPLIRHVFGISFLLLTFVNFFANFLTLRRRGTALGSFWTYWSLDFCRL